MDFAHTYWKDQYSTNLAAHSRQNLAISKDFLAQSSVEVWSTLKKSTTMLEMGCGTGELSHSLFNKFNTLKDVLGLDISEEAIEYATAHYQCSVIEETAIRSLKFKKYNFTAEPDLTKHFIPTDLIVCSNVLEHFKDPYSLLDKFLSLSRKVIVITPYQQPCTDGYDGEGGAGHVFTFDDDSFDAYQVVDKYTFSSGGWQFSSKGESPLQLVVLLEKKA